MLNFEVMVYLDVDGMLELESGKVIIIMRVGQGKKKNNDRISGDTRELLCISTVV